ncbi:hypothetical protein CDD81_8143 [Ophiocordyceps australis]|uniref:Fatty acid hydroxylase domain-containing protein n=1 Tax=Ophiocordyceps australis TaxID=1399860 RepID=A0A2C5Y2V4_9HYPO|nr:hypothetical protein CDD81_8143 [Ophiocordyceps australis]
MEVVLDYVDAAVLDVVYESARQRIQLNFCPLLHDKAPSLESVGALRKLAANLCHLATDTDSWARHSMLRQSISIFLLTWLLPTFFYFFFGTICYYQNFDPSLKNHPKFQPCQVRREMVDSLLALFWGSVLTVPVLLAQIHGFSKIYQFGSASWWYEVAQFPFFVLFSDTCMYWLHRIFHAPALFKLLHSKHHQYVIPTPFSAYAFDPLEAWIMSLPLYAFGFIWPMSDFAQLAVFCGTNVWTFLLRTTPHALYPLLAIPTCQMLMTLLADDNRDQFHTVHHKNINVNFGQYLPLWDRLGGTYRDPEIFLKPSLRSKR